MIKAGGQRLDRGTPDLVSSKEPGKVLIEEAKTMKVNRALIHHQNIQNGIDFNSIVEEGLYSFETTILSMCTNRPTDYAGALTVFDRHDFVKQRYEVCCDPSIDFVSMVYERLRREDNSWGEWTRVAYLKDTLMESYADDTTPSSNYIWLKLLTLINPNVAENTVFTLFDYYMGVDRLPASFTSGQVHVRLRGAGSPVVTTRQLNNRRSIVGSGEVPIFYFATPNTAANTPLELGIRYTRNLRFYFKTLVGVPLDKSNFVVQTVIPAGYAAVATS